MFGKPEKTPWEALVWAYAEENVRAANGHHTVPMIASALRRLGEGPGAAFEARGALAGYLDCHADAAAIESVVKGVTAGGREFAWWELEMVGDPARLVSDVKRARVAAADIHAEIAAAAEARVMPPPEIAIEPPRAAPLYDRGSPHPYVAIHPRARRPWYCPVEWAGTMPNQAARQRARHEAVYAAFLDVLVALQGREFDRFFIGAAFCD